MSRQPACPKARSDTRISQNEKHITATLFTQNIKNLRNRTIHQASRPDQTAQRNQAMALLTGCDLSTDRHLSWTECHQRARHSSKIRKPLGTRKRALPRFLGRLKSKKGRGPSGLTLGNGRPGPTNRANPEPLRETIHSIPPEPLYSPVCPAALGRKTHYHDDQAQPLQMH